MSDEREDKPRQHYAVPVALWHDICDFITDQVDVRDGSDGQPLPNEAMTLSSRIERCVSTAPVSSCAPSTDRTALIFFVAWAFAEGFFEDATELKERVRAWLIKEHAGIIDDLTIEQVVESVIARKSAVPECAPPKDAAAQGAGVSDAPHESFSSAREHPEAVAPVSASALPLAFSCKNATACLTWCGDSIACFSSGGSNDGTPETDEVVARFRDKNPRGACVALADLARALELQVARWKALYIAAQNANSYRQDALEDTRSATAPSKEKA